MHIIVLRIVAISLLLLAAFIPTRLLTPLARRSEVQLVAAVLIILVTVVDVPAGLALGCAAAAVWIRVSDAVFDRSTKGEVKFLGEGMNSVRIPYITPDNLKAAQSNVVNAEDYDNGIKGIDGISGRTVLGAQGLDKEMPGYTPFL